MATFGLLPPLLGGLLGVVAGARDIDEGVAPLAWNLSASRSRWLVEGLAPLVVMPAALCAVLMVAKDLVAAARLPIADINRTFWDDGVVSWPILFRSLAILGAGLLLGILVGRQLPALLLATEAAIEDEHVRTEAMPYGEPLVAIDAPAHQATDEARLGLDYWAVGQMLREADGTLMTREEALATAPNASDCRAALT